MPGFNTTALNDILNYLPIVIFVFGGLVSVFFFYMAMIRITWAAKLGGINSMGTKSFTVEAMNYILGAIVVGNVAWVISGISGDLITAQEYSWEPLADNTNSMIYTGKLLLAIANLFGIVLVTKGGMAIPKISDGQATISNVMWLIIIGVAATQLVWINQQIANFTVFNPLGFLLPETGSVINL